MASFKATLDPRASHSGKCSSVEITGDALVVDIDEAAIAVELADASAQSIAEQMRNAPGERWFKTGTLARGLTVERGADGKSAAVVAPPGRLERDPKLLEKLAEDIAAVRDPANDARVEQAIEETANNIVEVKR